ncbi:hypothetical protein [Streptomyces lunaelactis]|uniref:hypothetical protein n=1 Tax=Streptomyces lunaelactis TaxID=1535768 RepID=UPI001584C54A|nr:hypothetical protein [Streptomyces lunaelactis]NUL09084.1 hypothetical protein [Streptomyces lunaelactis]
MTQPDWPPTTVGQADSNPLTDSVIRAAVNDAIRQTSYRDDSPVPAIGTNPPVPQPGRPPMSQRATDASTLMLTGGAASLMVGGAASLVMVSSGYADPVVCALVFGAPTALVLAIGRLARSAKDVLPAEHHHHYKGTVNQDQRNVHHHNRWFGKSTTNL